MRLSDGSGNDGPGSNDRCACKRQERRDTDTEEKPHEDGGRDGRDAATSPGMPGASGGSAALPRLDLRPLTSRTVTG